jgi:hypothetical protein
MNHIGEKGNVIASWNDLQQSILVSRGEFFCSRVDHQASVFLFVFPQETPLEDLHSKLLRFQFDHFSSLDGREERGRKIGSDGVGGGGWRGKVCGVSFQWERGDPPKPILEIRGATWGRGRARSDLGRCDGLVESQLRVVMTQQRI